jgi:TetR/AcrR family transcriptional regulator, cholesterol catabolism regulator
MASKAATATRKPKSARVSEISNIPTTIKNPERVAYRRNELVEVATKLFLERGFHGTSIRDIVRVCSFNVASLYMYVSSKEDILFLVAQDLMNDISVKLSETILDPDSPVRSLEIGFASYCRIVNRHRRQVRLLYREVGFLPSDLRSNVVATVSGVVTFFEKIVDRGVAAGVFRDVPVRLAALNMMMVAHMLALHTREVMSFTDLDGYIKFQLDSVFAGLLVADARQRNEAPARPRRK